MTMNGLNELKLQNYQPLRDVVFEHIRNAILNGVLKPGERLMEVQLAEQLGVSRTPIREAIRKLELEGLIQMVARKGAYVTDISMKDFVDVIEVRSVLEGLAAFLAAERMTEKEMEELKTISREFIEYLESGDTQGMIKKDMEFHDKIFHSTRNPKLIQIVQGLQEQVQRFRVTYFSECRQSRDLVPEHEAIIKAIINKDGSEAQEVARNHIYMIKDRILDFAKKEK